MEINEDQNNQEIPTESDSNRKNQELLNLIAVVGVEKSVENIILLVQNIDWNLANTMIQQTPDVAKEFPTYKILVLLKDFNENVAEILNNHLNNQ